MRTSSGGPPLKRSVARNCILVNQLATPGLGSIMAGYRVEGAGQILLALAGFVMIVGWFILVARSSYDALVNDVAPQSSGWLGRAGLFTFLAAWFWALLTSRKIYLSMDSSEPTGVPPRLS